MPTAWGLKTGRPKVVHPRSQGVKIETVTDSNQNYYMLFLINEFSKILDEFINDEIFTEITRWL